MPDERRRSSVLVTQLNERLTEVQAEADRLRAEAAKEREVADKACDRYVEKIKRLRAEAKQREQDVQETIELLNRAKDDCAQARAERDEAREAIEHQREIGLRRLHRIAAMRGVLEQIAAWQEGAERPATVRVLADLAAEDLERDISSSNALSDPYMEQLSRLRAALRELREAAWDVYHHAVVYDRWEPPLVALRDAGAKADEILAGSIAPAEDGRGRGGISHPAPPSPALADEGERLEVKSSGYARSGEPIRWEDGTVRARWTGEKWEPLADEGERDA